MARAPPALAVLLAALVTMPASLALPAPPAGAVALIGPGGWTTTYATPVVVAVQGQPVTLVNGDIMLHDLVSDDLGGDGQPWCDEFARDACPLFWTPLLGLGGTAPVQGLERASALHVYNFHCLTHSGMTGMLVLAPAA